MRKTAGTAGPTSPSSEKHVTRIFPALTLGDAPETPEDFPDAGRRMRRREPPGPFQEGAHRPSHPLHQFPLPSRRRHGKNLTPKLPSNKPPPPQPPRLSPPSPPTTGAPHNLPSSLHRRTSLRPRLRRSLQTSLGLTKIRRGQLHRGQLHRLRHHPRRSLPHPQRRAAQRRPEQCGENARAVQEVIRYERSEEGREFLFAE